MNINEKNKQEDFNYMINKENNIAHYLMSTPFSYLNNLNYGNKLTPELFEKEFLVYKNLDAIEEEIIQYLKDISNNTVLITGYQGCGKTTFVNYLVKHIQESYQQNGIICNIDKIDFEKENEDENVNPFKKVLVRRIAESLCACTANREDKVLDFFINTYNSNRDVFTIIENQTEIQRLFDFINQEKDIDFNKDCIRKDKLYDEIRNLKVPQILTIWSYYIICKRYVEQKTDFVEILLLDNIDDIYKNKYTEKFIRGLKKYHELGSQFISNLTINGKTFSFNLYMNFNFIFCLRDTSAAKFSYHFTTRAVHFFHKDISEKVEKIEIINKKIDYLNKMEKCNLKNNADIIKHICNDNYTIKRIFPLYNNDYRTAINSLCYVLTKNEEYAREYCLMTEYKNSAMHFGAHGIVLRLILDSFESQGYFKAIGSYNIDVKGTTGEESKQHDLVDYSIPRIILTYLYNFQERHKDNFLNNLPDSTMNLKKLYDSFYKIINPKNISEKIEAMYALHLKQDWNHLINVNATYDVKSSNINSIFEEYKSGSLFKEQHGSVSITCAGRVFVQRITTHYEYFACRYFGNSIPLFLDENFETVDGKYKFDKGIEDVFGKVKNCIEKAYQFDLKIVHEYYNGDIEKFKESEYIYQKRQTHAERIINHNISYIDAYRHYVIQRIKEIEIKENLSDIEQNIYENKQDICETILKHIKNYVDLMEKYLKIGYFSKGAQDLYEQYSEGIKNIGTNYLSEQLISFVVKKGE